MTNNCKNCNHYKRLYRLFMYQYYKSKQRYCAFKDCLIVPTNNCAHWQKKKYEYDISVERLDKTLADVQYIIANADEERDT